MIRIYFKSAKDNNTKIITEFKAGSWLRIESPDDEEILQLEEKYKLSHGLIKDALDPNEVPRLEIDEGIVYVYTRVPYMDNEHVMTFPIMIAVNSNFIATVSSKDFSFFEKFISGKIDYSTTQKAKLLIQIFSEINEVYKVFTNKISKKNREMANKLEHITNDDIVEFVRFEEILNDFVASLTATNTVLKNLLHNKVIEFYESDRDLVEDMFLSNGQLIKSNTGNLRNIKNIREAYSAIMTQDLNRTIKIL
ncbi:MAG: CorA family divalent cation transporter, partial [bacterium]|nr:CorA family divalent cation transporter [bacterium]